MEVLLVKMCAYHAQGLRRNRKAVAVQLHALEGRVPEAGQRRIGRLRQRGEIQGVLVVRIHRPFVCVRVDDLHQGRRGAEHGAELVGMNEEWAGHR
jgi:hypothetical protein